MTTEPDKTPGPSGDAPDLERFFAAARRHAAEPDAGFLAELEREALSAMPTPRSVIAARPGVWALILDALGGWKGLGGLATACAAGLWLGVSPPEAFEVLLAQALGGDTLGVDPLSSFDFTLMEG